MGDKAIPFILSVKVRRMHEEYIQNFVGPKFSIVASKDFSLRDRSHPVVIIYGRLSRHRGGKTTVYLNSEQVTRKVIGTARRVRFLNLSPHHIYADYSQANIEVIKSVLPPLLHSRLCWVPYRFIPKERNFLEPLVHSKDKPYDLGVIGTSPRRLQIIHHLIENGLKVKHVMGFGDKRDVKMKDCKLLLNLHAHDDCFIFEHIRCDRWIFAGLPVVSEDSVCEDQLDIYPLVRFSKREDLVATLKSILKEWPSFWEDHQKKCNDLVPPILKTREEAHALFQSRL